MPRTLLQMPVTEKVTAFIQLTRISSAIRPWGVQKAFTSSFSAMGTRRAVRLRSTGKLDLVVYCICRVIEQM